MGFAVYGKALLIGDFARCFFRDRLIRDCGNPLHIFLHLNSPFFTGNDSRVQLRTGKTIGKITRGTEMKHFEGEVMLPAAIAGVAANGQQKGSLVQVLFDSYSLPALAGTRSTAMSLREIVYRAEPYQIDLQVEVQPERNRLVITGQLLDVSHPEKVGLDVPITLSNLRGTVVRTVTNQFGEFRGELENSGNLELSFFGRDGKPIVILLRGARKQLSGAKQ